MGIMLHAMPLPKLDVQPVSPVPVWRQIADHVIAAVESGELRPGEKLPGGRWLAGDWGVGYSTVAKAMSWLIAEGVLISTPGKGTFVPERQGDAES
jgi:DNA-binding GntR family transcriptional regulator